MLEDYDNNHVFHSFPKQLVTEINCASFFKKDLFKSINFKEKKYDLAIVSRLGKNEKKADLSIKIIERLLKYKELKILIFLTFDNEDNYTLKQIESLKKNINNFKNIKNVSFFSACPKYFKNFQIDDEIFYDLLSKTKYLMINSLNEGHPLVMVESWLSGTKVILPAEFNSTIKKFINIKNSSYYNHKNLIINFDDEVKKIYNILNVKYNSDEIYNSINRNYFLEDNNKQKFVDFCSKNFKINFNKENCNDWFLNNLNKRLAQTLQLHETKIMNNENFFFEYFNLIENLDNIQDFEELLIKKKLNNYDRKTFIAEFYLIISEYKRKLNKLFKTLTNW